MDYYRAVHGLIAIFALFDPQHLSGDADKTSQTVTLLLKISGEYHNLW